MYLHSDNFARHSHRLIVHENVLYFPMLVTSLFQCYLVGYTVVFSSLGWVLISAGIMKELESNARKLTGKTPH